MTDAINQPNFRSPAASLLQAEVVQARLFELTPLPMLVLTPELRIVDANEAYLAAVDRRRDGLAGLEMFEAFPDSPHDALANGVANLGASFARVLMSGEGEFMTLQRYDIQPEGKPWEVRYWQPVNWVVRDDAGSVLALVHHVRDVTGSALAEAHTQADQPRPTDPIARAERAIREAQGLREKLERDLARARHRTSMLLFRTPD